VVGAGQPARQCPFGRQCGPEAGGAGHIGVHGAQREQESHDCGDQAGRLADPDGQQVGQRSLTGTQLRAEHGDVGAGHGQVEHADHGDRQHGGLGDVPARVRIVRRQRGDRLPAGEGPDQHGGRDSDCGPALRSERDVVGRLRMRQCDQDRDHHQRDQHADHDQLGASGDVQAQPVQDEHHGDDHSEGGQAGQPAPAQGIGHVASGERCRHRRSHRDGQVEDPAHGVRCGAAEGLPDVAGHPAGVRESRAQFGEQPGQRRRDHDQGQPRQNRGRSGHRGRHGRQRNDAGPQHCAGAHGRALGDGQLVHAATIGHMSGATAPRTPPRLRRPAWRCSSPARCWPAASHHRRARRSGPARMG